MQKPKEETIGTFLYAASSRSYLLYHLVFTSSRILAASISWEKNNIFIDTVIALIQSPSHRGIMVGSMLMENWKNVNSKGKPLTSYERSDIMDIGLVRLIFHEIQTIPYSMLKRITVEEDPLNVGYRIRFDAGMFNSSTFLIPEYAVSEFSKLVEMTPAAKKLAVFGSLPI
jgi:hypothetical protein